MLYSAGAVGVGAGNWQSAASERQVQESSGSLTGRGPVPAAFRSSHDDDLLHLVRKQLREHADEEGDVGEGSGRDDGEFLIRGEGPRAVRDSENGGLALSCGELLDDARIVGRREPLNTAETVLAMDLCELDSSQFLLERRLERGQPQEIGTHRCRPGSCGSAVRLRRRKRECVQSVPASRTRANTLPRWLLSGSETSHGQLRLSGLEQRSRRSSAWTYGEYGAVQRFRGRSRCRAS